MSIFLKEPDRPCAFIPNQVNIACTEDGDFPAFALNHAVIHVMKHRFLSGFINRNIIPVLTVVRYSNTEFSSQKPIVVAFQRVVFYTLRDLAYPRFANENYSMVLRLRGGCHSQRDYF